MTEDDVDLSTLGFGMWLAHPHGGNLHAFMLWPELGVYTGVKRLLFHWTLLVGHMDDRSGYEDHWCYQTEAGAVSALLAWNPAEGEPEGWHKNPRTGRYRTGGNPDREWNQIDGPPPPWEL